MTQPASGVAVDDLDVVAGGRDMLAYSSPLLECLPSVMVVSFLGDVGRRDRYKPLLGQSSSTGSVAELRLRRSGVGDGDRDLWERGRLAGVI